ncbi:TIR domain-containing protein [Sphingopyxis sp. 2PD]|uniref:TIR domain-containing protein n=1 Tax=Sphingopyxis sp. 2PD TaxID=2502196 RepID=UPI0010F52F8B|nr:TIR domain-containing protein [Sphingopyxis sp. 2PD]
MPYLHNYRLFVSHAWRYSEGYNRAVRFLNDANNFVWTNYSVPVDKKFEGMSDEQLRLQLAHQIRPTQCVVVLAGMYAHHSNWIHFEMEYAKLLKKPILGIVPWGQERTPQLVQNYATKMVAWNAASIVAGIREITP